MSDIADPPLLAALHGRNHGHPPVWMMRQAGRTLASYRALRAGVPFIEFCKSVDLATRATLLPVEELGVDAAILFADILLPIEALGVGLRFEEGIGPISTPAIRDASVAAGLTREPIEAHCSYVAEIIASLRKQLPVEVPLIGFCPSPWTLAAYAVEGRARKGFPGLKRFLYGDPEAFRRLLDLFTELLCEYAAMQVSAGAQAFQIFDTWAELLPPHLLESLVLPRVDRIAGTVAGDVPVIYFPKGTAGALDVVDSLTHVSALGCDWTVSLPQVRARFGDRFALQGNLDPTVLLSDPDKITHHTHRLLDEMKGDPGYVVNLGHGLSPEIPEANVHAFVQAVRSWGT